MKISTKGRYAIRLLLDLAENSSGDYVSLNDVAERQDISKKYLEQIIILLNRGDLLLSSRGKSGGYKLKVPPEKISLMDVLKITEASTTPTPCNLCGHKDCSTSPCRLADIWINLDSLIHDYLDKITISDISKGSMNI